MKEEELMKLTNSLNSLLDKANDCLKEIERLELDIHKYIAKELNSGTEKVSEEFLKYSIEKIDQALLLHEIYNKGVIVMNKIIVNNLPIPQEVREFWNQVNVVIRNEIEEQELLGNYILDYSEGKELTDSEKEFMKKTFSGISKLKNKEE